MHGLNRQRRGHSKRTAWQVIIAHAVSLLSMKACRVSLALERLSTRTINNV